MTLKEAAPELGGQFRLAGLQPRRGQILDLLSWYERQLAQLQVRVERNAFVECEDLTPDVADAVILATGSQPDLDGFQRALPHLDIGHRLAAHPDGSLQMPRFRRL